MPNSINTRTEIVPMFDYMNVKGNVKGADASADASPAVEGLLKEAAVGDSDAISALINFTAGTDDALGLRAKAEQGLLDIYSNPKTSSHIRKEIAAQAHACYELCERNKEKQAGEMQLNMPFKLLYLAGRHESSRFGLSRTLDKIAKVFQNALRAFELLADKNIFSSTRTVTSMEMQISHAPHGAFKGQKVEILALNWGETATTMAVKEITKELLSETVGAPKAKAAFVLISAVGGDHWVPIVFRREGDKVGGYILDSSLPSGIWNHNPVTRTMQRGLGEHSAGFHYKYAEMQGLTNTCGLMTTRFISWMDTQLVTNPNMDILNAMDGYVAEWKSYTSEQQKAITTGMRAEKLAKLAEISSPPNFNLSDYINSQAAS